MRWSILWAAGIVAALAVCGCPHARSLPATGSEAVRSDREFKQQANEAVMPSQLPQPVPSGARGVMLETADQYHVSSWYFAPQKGAGKAPGVILVHQYGRDKGCWGNLPAKLVDEGYAVIAIDLRGHGETTDAAGRRVPIEALTEQDFQAMLQDIAAAHEFLLSQKGLDHERVAIIGASIGANLGIMYCAGDRRVRTVVALSPGLDYRSLKPLDYMAAVDKRPVYLIAARGDEDAARAAEDLSRAGTTDGPKSLRLFNGKDHGSDLLRANPGLDMTIVTGWLPNYLPPDR